MKKIPSWIILLSVEIVVALFLLFYGFRFTYAPEIENSWNAISAFAAWASVIASSIAIFVAIWIPKRIAENQNRITLFEKRFQFYNVIMRCSVFARALESTNDIEQVNRHFLLAFEDETCADVIEDNVYSEIIRILHYVLSEIRAGKFLFPYEMETELEEICNTLINLIGKSKTEEQIKSNYLQYRDAINKFMTGIMPQIKKALTIA